MLYKLQKLHLPLRIVSKRENDRKLGVRQKKMGNDTKSENSRIWRFYVSLGDNKGMWISCPAITQVAIMLRVLEKYESSFNCNRFFLSQPIQRL